MKVFENNGYVVYAQREGNTDAEYEEFLSLFRQKPSAPEGYDYFLRWQDRVWELVKIEEDDPDVDDAEALNILLGGAT